MEISSGLPVSLPDIYAPRESLLRLIDRAVAKQVVYIQAMGGYGKTVSTLLWLKKTNCRAAWRCFDEYDDTPALFYMIFCRLLLSVLPQDKNLTALINAPAFRNTPVEYTIEILTKADYGKERIVLVLDDFHTIKSEPVLKALPYVLKRLPDNASVFFLSRGELPTAFNILQETDRISVINSQELAFSTVEIQKHFASYARFITEQEAFDIRSFSDGWIILLNMMLKNSNLKIDSGNARITLKNYFEKSIWNALDEKKRDFLLKTAVPDSFSLELCKALTSSENCEEMLEELIRGNANLSCSDGEYRYHQLFLEFLRGKIPESSIQVSAIFQLTAEYYLSKNNTIPARHFAVRSGDMDTMAKTARMINISKNVNVDEYVGLAYILNKNQLPDALCDTMPFLYLQKVYVAFLLGDHQNFEHFWDKIYSLFPMIAEKFPQFMETNVTNSILDFRYTFAEHANRVRRMPAVIHKNEIDQVSSIAINLPFLHRSCRDCYELADAAIRESVVDEVFKDLLKYDCDNLFLGIQAGLYIEQNRLDEAQNVLLHAESLLNDKVSIDLGWATYIMLAETALLKGDRSGYERYKAQGKEYFESRRAFYYIRNYSAYEIRTKLWEGDVDAAQDWLNQYFVVSSEYGVLYKIYQNFTTARAYIIIDNKGEALCVLNSIRAVAKAFGRLLDVAEADVLIAIVEWRSGKKKESIDRFYKLLAALCPFHFTRVAANEGKAVLPIIAAVIKEMEKETARDEAQYRFVKEVNIVAYEQSKRFNGITHSLQLKTIKLSPKQTRLLELLSKGHKNAEIIKITGCSINTIRSYTRIIYRKLEVTNAMDAIVKAKQLGILN